MAFSTELLSGRSAAIAAAYLDRQAHSRYFTANIIIRRESTKLEKGNLRQDLCVGVDLESIARFEKMIRRFQRATLRRIYTDRELEYCFAKKNPAPSLAARFAFKEAAFKALSPLGQRIYHRQIEIRNSASGAPQARFLSDQLNSKFTLKVSLSHSRHDALAMVVAIRNE